MKDPIEKMTYEMTDAELREHEAGMEAAMARLFDGIEVQPTGDESNNDALIYNPDGSWHDEATGQDFDADGDLIEENDDFEEEEI